jgi:hypothetical protein
MNNSVSPIVNENSSVNIHQKSLVKKSESIKKKLILISLSFNSLGIIFGDM